MKQEEWRKLIGNVKTAVQSLQIEVKSKITQKSLKMLNKSPNVSGMFLYFE